MDRVTPEQLEAIKARLAALPALTTEELKENLKYFDSFPTQTYSTSDRQWSIIRKLEKVASDDIATVGDFCARFGEFYLTEYQAPAFRVLESFGVTAKNHLKPFNEKEALDIFKAFDKEATDQLRVGNMHDAFRMCFNACVLITPEDEKKIKEVLMRFGKTYEVMSHIFQSLKVVLSNGSFEGSEKIELMQLEINDILDGHPNRAKRARNEANGNKYRPSLSLSTLHTRLADCLQQERPGDIYKYATAFVVGYGHKLAELYKLVSSSFSHLVLSRTVHERTLPCEHLLSKYGLRPFTNFFHFTEINRSSTDRRPLLSALLRRLSLKGYLYLSRCGVGTGGPTSFLTLIKALRPLWRAGASRADKHAAREILDISLDNSPKDCSIEFPVEPLSTLPLRRWFKFRGEWVQYYYCKTCETLAKYERPIVDHGGGELTFQIN